MESLATRVAQAPIATVEGTWHRHVAAGHTNAALEGRTAFGRWGTPDGFRVLYLGQPRSSVVVEAYRHLVDPVEDYQPEMIATRAYVTCTVNVQEVLDLRTATGRASAGLPLDVLTSETRNRDVYRQCQEVSAVAHQLGLHGLIAPAATGLGETLVVFRRRSLQPRRSLWWTRSTGSSCPATPGHPAAAGTSESSSNPHGSLPPQRLTNDRTSDHGVALTSRDIRLPKHGPRLVVRSAHPRCYEHDPDPFVDHRSRRDSGRSCQNRQPHRAESSCFGPEPGRHGPDPGRR